MINIKVHTPANTNITTESESTINVDLAQSNISPIAVSVYEDDTLSVQTNENTSTTVDIANEVVFVTDNDYEILRNKPSINGHILSGNLIIKEDATFVFKQHTPENVWQITHNLNKYPSVSITDSAGSIVIGECIYLSLNAVECRFSSEFSGTAYLN